LSDGRSFSLPHLKNIEDIRIELEQIKKHHQQDEINHRIDLAINYSKSQQRDEEPVNKDVVNKTKKILITGMHGMIAPRVASILNDKGFEVIAWNRDEVSIDDENAINQYINQVNPDIIYHLAYGPESWAKTMANTCFIRNIKFIYISTVNVYGDTKGPLTKTSIVAPNDEYSNYKYSCEKEILSVNSKPYILRLGWQID
jgi:rhodanese-related sulfurtransferase